MCPRKRMKHRSNPINCSDRIGTRKNPRLGRGFRFLGRNQTISRSLQFTSSHILHLCWNPENDDFNEIFFNLHLCLGSQKNIKLSRTFQFFPNQTSLSQKSVHIGLTSIHWVWCPPKMPVTTRIIAFSIWGSRTKPSYTFVTGRGPQSTYTP